MEGAEVVATAELERVENGKFYVLRVAVSDGEKEIGRGTVTRAFVSMERFRGLQEKGHSNH